ncbi:MAG: hypothetical protein SNJ82_07840, partial [Gemmataceae bacterium]
MLTLVVLDGRHEPSVQIGRHAKGGLLLQGVQEAVGIPKPIGTFGAVLGMLFPSGRCLPVEPVIETLFPLPTTNELSPGDSRLGVSRTGVVSESACGSTTPRRLR